MKRKVIALNWSNDQHQGGQIPDEARPVWRVMKDDDLQGVVRVARAAFPDHFEAPACFAERFRLFPAGSFTLATASTISGYLIAYPWPPGEIPPLNSLLGELPECSCAWYLHDLALAPDVRGHGYTRQIVEHLAALALAAGIQVIALVSVNDTRGFWESLGFKKSLADEKFSQKLASYGEKSIYMTRELAR